MKPASSGTGMGQMLECSPDLGNAPPAGQGRDSLLYYMRRSHLGGLFLSCHDPRVSGGVPGGTSGWWVTHWRTSVISPFFSGSTVSRDSALLDWFI